MDIAIDAKNFPILSSKITGSHVLKSIRLLCVFGCNGAEVIFSTTDDLVFCYGRNRFGGLGLGHENENLDKPEVNRTLSNKQLENIYCGFEHWIGLTAGGHCYAWGHNTSGQLAIAGIEATATPQLVSSLTDEKLIRLSCGAYHTLALTADGRVLGWGDNSYGQLGEGSTTSHVTPRLVQIREAVKDICCGRNHSIALTAAGRVYVWGLNSHSQLGCKSYAVFHSSLPELIPGLESTKFSGITCGPNYTLLLSNDGHIYAFGDNSCGQIGNGLSTEFQTNPFKIESQIKFKQIIAHKENDISIAVSTDDKFYVWGLAKNRRHLIPELVEEWSGESSFDVYAMHCKKIVTYKTIVINSELKSWETIKRNSVINAKSEENEPKNDLNCIERLYTNNTESNDSFEIMANSEEPEENPWHLISNSVKRPKQQSITLDRVLDMKIFVRNPSIIDDFMRKNIRLFRVFGIYGMKVIFATNEDKVYAFGHNKDKCLGVGTSEVHVLRPTPIKELCGKKLVDIANGYEHCIALTGDGHCYGWGLNAYGQIGSGTIADANRPQFVDELVDKRVVKIVCGAYHSVALTSDGNLFSWGHNTFAQLGDRTYNSRDRPTQVLISEKIVDMAAGNNHNIALTECGHVYVWGVNEMGQLGRPPEQDVRLTREKPMSNRPHLLTKLENVFIVKGVCGPNHCVLLSRDGDIYAFGANDCGQVGNGTTNPQYSPMKLNKDIKIKNIVSDFDNDISFAVDVNDKFFVWGFALNKKVLRPQEVKTHFTSSLYNTYAKLAKNRVTFNTVIVGQDMRPNYVTAKPKTLAKPVPKAEVAPPLVTDVYESDESDERQSPITTNRDVDPTSAANQNRSKVYDIGVTENMSRVTDKLREMQFREACNSSPDLSYTEMESVSGNSFLDHLRKSFNDPNDHDLRVECGHSGSGSSKVIYCHKTIIQIRNDKFWQFLESEINWLDNQIVIQSDLYPLFHAFIQYLYAIEPHIDGRFVNQLKTMAKLFDEPLLTDMCDQWTQHSGGDKVTVDLSNVCYLYEKAVKEGLAELEKTCVEFAANHLKSVMRSEGFDAMDDSVSKRLLVAIVR